MTHAIMTSSSGLEIAVGQSGTSTIVRLKGRVDIDSSPDLRDRLLALIKQQPSDAIAIDLSEVPYIDTSGIATLIEALKITRQRTKSFCLQGLTGSVLHLFEVTGVLALFQANGRSRGSCAEES